jgi:DNA-binding CsgD family transcriptional regulator
MARSLDIHAPRCDESGAGCARDLSALLLDLYTLAQRTGIGEFEHYFFMRLAAYLPFDAGWTGAAALTDSGPVVHNWQVYSLPGRFFTSWTSIREVSPFLELARNPHEKACMTQGQSPSHHSRFRKWTDEYGLRHLMMICVPNRDSGLSTFLTLYRRARRGGFSDVDAGKLENLIPHLASALALNRAAHLEQQRSQTAAAKGYALCDALGAIHRADAAFHALMSKEWPGCPPGSLPGAASRHLAPAGVRDEPYLGRFVTLRVSPLAGLYQITAQPRSPLDDLTSREQSVACHFGQGLSHKEVARRLGIAPATVRHYLRSIYRKLDIHDKSGISRLCNVE